MKTKYEAMTERIEFLERTLASAPEGMTVRFATTELALLQRARDEMTVEQAMQYELDL